MVIDWRRARAQATIDTDAPVKKAASGTPEVRASLARDLLTLIRPYQWPKNLFVVPLALIDTPVWTADRFLRIVWAVVAFTLASCAVYVFNDICDRGRDREHPTKRYRPIADGRVTVPVAILYLMVIVAVLITLLLESTMANWWPLAVYLAINICYSRGLRHVPLLDIFMVAIGFLLRMLQGYEAIGTRASGWLAIGVLSLCLMLVLGKRRHELVVVTKDGRSRPRPALRGYSELLTNQLIMLNAMMAMLGYTLYVQTDQPAGAYNQLFLIASAPLVLFGISRYLQLIFVFSDGADPVRIIFGDRVIRLVGVSWSIFAGVVLLIRHYPG